jgi:hypothetical protein
MGSARVRLRKEAQLSNRQVLEKGLAPDLHILVKSTIIQITLFSSVDSNAIVACVYYSLL